MSIKRIKKSRGNLPQSNITPVRVQAVVLNDQDYPDVFDELDKWHAIGTILYSEIKAVTCSSLLFWLL